MELNYEDSRMIVMFYPFFFLRRIIVSVVLYNLGSVPGAQILIFISLAIILSIGVWRFKPFEDELLNKLCVFNEVCLVICLGLFGIFNLDLSRESIDAVQYLTMAVVSLNILAQFGVVIYTCYKAYQSVKNQKSTKSTVMPETLVTKTERNIPGTFSSSLGFENLLKSQVQYSSPEPEISEGPEEIIHNVSERHSAGEDMSFHELSENSLPEDSQNVSREVFKNNYFRHFDEEEDVEVINPDD